MSRKIRTVFISLVVVILGTALHLGVTTHHPAADSFQGAFELLKTPEAMTNVPYREQLIEKAFLRDSSSGIEFLLEKLWTAPSSENSVHRQTHEMDCFVARIIFGKMPVDVQEELVGLKVATPVRRARLLETVGEFRTPLALQELRKSLADQRISGMGTARSDGWPLRVCDIAYNTLILRLGPEDFRAPLGSHYSHAQRDRWIRELEAWLQENAGEAVARFSSSP